MTLGLMVLIVLVCALVYWSVVYFKVPEPFARMLLWVCIVIAVVALGLWVAHVAGYDPGWMHRLLR